MFRLRQQRMETRNYDVGTMIVEVAATAKELGRLAAELTAKRIRELAADSHAVPVVFATGASQVETLRALTRIPDIPWDCVIGFHLDEYIGIDGTHPASFRHYLCEELVSRVPMREFWYVEGDAKDPLAICRKYADKLLKNPPRLCLLGIGENGHLAFNDPGEADFDDPESVKIVSLDAACRQQQVNEGWFANIEAVPVQAITMTIPALMGIPELIASVPGERKAVIVRKSLTEPISPDVPATVLLKHPNVHLFLDSNSAAGMRSMSPSDASPDLLIRYKHF